MKQQIRKMLLAVILFGGGLWIGSLFVSQAEGITGGNLPGSANDPLVTKSYVDEQIQAALSGRAPGSTPSASQELTIVQLKPGFTLIADAGTEMIVRNGKTVVVSDTVDGIPDVTLGSDIRNGELVENNHLLISPVKGRGIQPHESVTGTIFVMVRGNFTLTQSES